MDIKLRKYGETDLDDVLSAWENASHVGHPFLTKTFIASEKDNVANMYMPNANSWVAVDQNRVVGFISMVGNEVGGLFVQPAYHGRGVGWTLMNKAQKNHGDLEVEVFEKNAIGRKFYERYGFELIETKMHEETSNRLLRLKFIAG
ncbi:MAG: GNAT family N-acetyltransferase [Anaerolineae bacterium]